MNSAQNERIAPARTAGDEIVALLLGQHARIRNFFTEIKGSQGEVRKHAFGDLRALLAVHEVAEELVERPVAKQTAGNEEAEAAQVLKRLEGMNVSSPKFEQTITEFEKAVSEHADHEETEEFPAIIAHCTDEQRHDMGRRLLRAEHLAPTRPHSQRRE